MDNEYILEYNIGDTVYHLLDEENKGIIVGMNIRDGGVSYFVVWKDMVERLHSPSELTNVKPEPEVKPIGFIEKPNGNP
jgi:hypothetical protein